jgi:hypothetical protein
MSIQSLTGKKYRINLGAFGIDFEFTLETIFELTISDSREAAETGYRESLDINPVEIWGGFFLSSWPRPLSIHPADLVKALKGRLVMGKGMKVAATVPP